MIRTMTEQDLPTVKKLMQSIPNFWHSNWNNKTLFKAFYADDDLALVFIEDKHIIGCIFGYDCGFRGYLAGLAVADNSMNKNIGSELVGKLEDLLKGRNCELVITDALKTAMNFFIKCGWDSPQSVLLRKRLIEKENE